MGYSVGYHAYFFHIGEENYCRQFNTYECFRGQTKAIAVLHRSARGATRNTLLRYSERTPSVESDIIFKESPMKRISFLIKPASSLCNMRCRYCFYADVAQHREVSSFGIMQRDVMEALIDSALGLGDNADITFAFQGGEPTCAGLEYFEAFTAHVARKRSNQTIHYALQTNGYLIDRTWATFLTKHDFLVGVSLDGYRDLHDWLRPDATGSKTFSRILKAIQALRSAGAEFNILTVLTAQLAKHPQQLYRFYRQQKFNYVQLIPCLPGLDDAEDEFSLTPEAFASFYKVFFRLWLKDFEQGCGMSVTLFDNVIPLFAGYPPQQCGMLGACAPQFVVEGNGDVYPCDFYVLDRYRLGNVAHDSLEQMATCDELRAFLVEPRRACSECADCPFESICHKNCKRLNIAYYRENYCGYRDFLEEVAPAMASIAGRL